MAPPLRVGEEGREGEGEGRAENGAYQRREYGWNGMDSKRDKTIEEGKVESRVWEANLRLQTSESPNFA